MKSFRKFFSELGKSCFSNCEHVVQLNDFFAHVFVKHVFLHTDETLSIFCVVPAIWVFLGV